MSLTPSRVKPLIVMGTSQGGFSVLRAAAGSDLINAVISENPYISVKRLLLEFPAMEWLPRAVKYGSLYLIGFWIGEPVDELDVRQFAAGLGSKPVLLIHGDHDTTVNVHHSQDILGVISGPKELWVVNGGEHEQLWNLEPLKYQVHVLEFLTKLR